MNLKICNAPLGRKLVVTRYSAGKTAHTTRRWPRWQTALSHLPAATIQHRILDQSAPRAHHPELGRAFTITTSPHGPTPVAQRTFAIDDLHIDAEWQSNRNVDRLAEHGIAWHDRDVLDIGCGNAYYARRMMGAGAKQVLGVDPMPLMHFQFHALSRYLGDDGISPCLAA